MRKRTGGKRPPSTFNGVPVSVTQVVGQVLLVRCHHFHVAKAVENVEDNVTVDHLDDEVLAIVGIVDGHEDTRQCSRSHLERDLNVKANFEVFDCNRIRCGDKTDNALSRSQAYTRVTQSKGAPVEP